MEEQCRAAVITAYNKPIEVRGVKMPENIEGGAILAKMIVASICGSDIHLWKGGVSQFFPISLPVIGGHEGVGEIVGMGQGVQTDVVGQSLSIGDRIIWTHPSCGKCFYCSVLRQPMLCINRNKRHYMYATCNNYPYLLGTFAEYAYVSATCSVIKVPDEIPSEWATAASCALRSVIHGFSRLGRVENWESILIQGAGPLGLFATAVATNAGAASVIVVGAPSQRLEVAKKWGASATIDISKIPDAMERHQMILDLTGKRGPDVIIEVSGAVSAVPEGLALIRSGGRYLLLGQTASHRVELQPSLITQRQVTVVGSFSGHGSEYWRALRFMEETREKYDFGLMLSGRYRLEEINEAINDMQSFKAIKPLIDLTLGK